MNLIMENSEKKEKKEKKVFYLENGQEVSFGNTITYGIKESYSFGEYYENCTVTITPSNYKSLIEKGIIRESSNSSYRIKTVPVLMNMTEVINEFAKENEIEASEAIRIFDVLGKADSISLVRFLVRFLANYYNSQYNSSTSEYYIGLDTGSVGLDTNDTFRNKYYGKFVCFDDAIYARNIIMPILSKINGEQED